MRYFLTMLLFTLVLVAGCFLSTTTSPYAAHKKKVSYVGMQTCRSCHSDVYESYFQTGMGQSFRGAALGTSHADFSASSVVYDTLNNLYYTPFIKDSLIYVKEYRLDGSDTTYSRTEQIDYIVGSGHHTNSHLIWRSGYLYQAPITYYTQDGKWDLAPGFEGGNNQRFNRAIESECVTCHNHFPTPVHGSTNKYYSMPEGIECERCHGPGQAHVEEKLAGIIVDTSKEIDYSIINPRDLTIEQQMDICQRCHLQGVAVLRDTANFYDFIPGQALSDHMDIYLPRFSDSDERFIMASQADRLKLSDCFTVSGSLSCISCHNPHHDVQSNELNRYNETCNSCHNPSSQKSILHRCSESDKILELNNHDCVSCHMPPSNSIDIPHVSITDHYIRKNYQSDTSKTEQIRSFFGLSSLLRPNPPAIDKARAYLHLYDKFMSESMILDSAFYYMQLVENKNQSIYIKTLIHYHFNRGDYRAICEIESDHLLNMDAWTYYRLADAYVNNGQLQMGISFIEKATEELPYHLPFQEKKGVYHARSGAPYKAIETLEFVVDQDPTREKAWYNLGLTYAQSGALKKSYMAFKKALELNPDYKQAQQSLQKLESL